MTFSRPERDPSKKRRGRGWFVGAAATVAAAALVSTGGTATFALGTAQSTVAQSVVDDPMSRTVSDGWGSAPTGGAYSYDDPTAFSVKDGFARVELRQAGESRTASLPAVSVRDVDASYTLGASQEATTGRGVSSGLQLRLAGSSYYLAYVRFIPAGGAVLEILRVDGSPDDIAVLASTPLASDVTSGARVYIEASVTGSDAVSLKARAWAGTDDRPAWQISASDDSDERLTEPGSVAVWNYTSRSSGPAIVAVDDLKAVSLGDGETEAPTPVPSPAPGPTPVPAPSPEPAPNPAPAPIPPQSDPAPVNGSGSAPVGQASYPVPAEALFVSPAGEDSAAGSQSSPIATLAEAVRRAPSGGTIVMRAGTYHESVKIPDGKNVTIQSYPSEAVWLDGSTTVSSWKQSSNKWVHSGWTAEFDASPTFTKGAPDNDDPGWSFVNPSHPMAAHPDQVWIDGIAQRQVASAAAVTTGTFYADYANNALVLGSDPSGKTVRASDLAKALSIRGDGSTIRGIGIRRYANSVPSMGAVTMEKPGITVENVVISDNATTGLFGMESGNVVRNVTLARNGMLGGSFSTADNLTGVGILAKDNNTERFNYSPVSGGVKIGRSRGVTISDSSFLSNAGPGLWFDESVYNGTVTGNRMVGNDGHGLILEISAKFDVVDNIVSDNRTYGMKINDTAEVNVWNNTVVHNGTNIAVLQDERRASNLSVPGHDPRQPLPDPTMTWINGPVTISNNVIANGRDSGCMLCVLDYSEQMTAEQMRVTVNGNVYGRPSATAPQTLVSWSRGSASPISFPTMSGFAQSTGQEKTGRDVVGTPVVTQSLELTDSIRAQEGSIAVALPTRLATLAGQQPGVRHVGSWLRL